jgi:dihydroorotase
MTTSTQFSGRVVFPDGLRPAEITVDAQSGIILSVRSVHHVQEDGTLIFPGFIDAHVHAREYAAPDATDPEAMGKWEASCRKETFATAGRAAINGGVTLFGAMPNDPNPPDTPERYNRKLEIAATSACPVVPFAVVTPLSEPWRDLPYKVYLDAVSSPVSFSKWENLEDTIERYRQCRIFFHAEDPDVLRRHQRPGPRWSTRPPEAEVAAVRKILDLTAKHDLRTHLCHISTEKTALLLADYNRSAGRKVTSEVTPHHLFFSVDEDGVYAAHGQIVGRPDLLGCNPPVRSEHDRRFLIDALKEGLVDLLASDHAPHTLEDKQNGAPGMPHLDTLGAFAAWLIAECGFAPQRVAQVLSTQPAGLFAHDVDVPHGVVETGAAASFTVLDLKASTLVQGGEIAGRGPLQTRCGWSPFDGIALPGRVTSTVVRGKHYRF